MKATINGTVVEGTPEEIVKYQQLMNKIEYVKYFKVKDIHIHQGNEKVVDDVINKIFNLKRNPYTTVTF